MPLTLPDGVYAVPQHFGNVLTDARNIRFTYTLLSPRETVLGTLDGEQPSGSLSWSASASVKGSGTLSVLDVGQTVNWLNVRIAPKATITGIDGEEHDYPMGVFLASAPKETWTDLGRVWEVELLDKCSILDQDVVGDAIEGTAPTYSLPAGTNVIEAVKAVITGAGESTAAILPDADAVLAGPMTWDAGTTRLKVVNDLLDAANYFSLWVDYQGQFQCTKYTAPSSRPVKWLDLRPFEAGPTSVFSPDFDRDVDIYSIPNRVVAIQQGDGEDEGLVATVENTNPDSPYSYQSRGRWIVKVYDQVEAVDQAALTAYAQRMLASAMSVTGADSIKNLYMPDLKVNDVIKFTTAAVDSPCTVQKIEVSLNPIDLCSTELSEVPQT